MKAITRAWQRFWFAPAPAINLGVCRILFFGAMFAIYASENYYTWANVPKSLWRPQWIFETFHIPVFNAHTLLIISIVWKTALAMACLGLLFPASSAVALLGGIYLLGLRHNFGKLFHYDAILIFTMGFMLLSHAGRVMSLDNLIWPPRKSQPLPLEDNGEYRWPIRAVWMMLSIVFFASAIAKLRQSGLEWAFSDNLRTLFVRYWYYNHPATDLGLKLAQWPRVCQCMAAGGLAVELFFPLVMVSRAARWILVPAAIALQIGNKLLLGVDFKQFMLVYLFFVDERWILQTIGLRTANPVTAETSDRLEDVDSGIIAH